MNTIIKHCAKCQQEFNIFPQKGDIVTHGICYRHALASWTDVLESSFLAEKQLSNKPDSDFCPDMAQVFDG